MQARLEQEMKERQELGGQLEAERAKRQAQAQRLMDITDFLQGLGQRVGFSLLAGLLVPPPPPRPAAAATPVSMKVFLLSLVLCLYGLYLPRLAIQIILSHMQSFLLCAVSI